jgi:hypothetical protein
MEDLLDLEDLCEVDKDCTELGDATLAPKAVEEEDKLSSDSHRSSVVSYELMMLPVQHTTIDLLLATQIAEPPQQVPGTREGKWRGKKDSSIRVHNSRHRFLADILFKYSITRPPTHQLIQSRPTTLEFGLRARQLFPPSASVLVPCSSVCASLAMLTFPSPRDGGCPQAAAVGNC